jgi:hypothetical protein
MFLLFVCLKCNVKHNKFFQALLCISLVLAFASTGLCGFLSFHTTDAYCKRSVFLDHGTLAAPSGACKLLPCDSRMKSPLLSENSSDRQVRTEGRQIFQTTSTIAIQDTPRLSLKLSSAMALRDPLSTLPPVPLFSLHCSLLR